MEQSAEAVQSLKARADEFRARAADCSSTRYSELMRKGAAHLDERARVLEASFSSHPSTGLAEPHGINGADL